MRIAIFFDGKNFHSGWVEKANNREIDFVALSKWLIDQCGGTQLWGAFYYVGLETGDLADTDGQRRLARFLRSLELLPGYFVKRFERKHKTAKCHSCHRNTKYTQEKEVDTTMVADMLRLAAVNAFDSMILISGDRDHLPAVEGVQALGKKAYVASWGGRGLAGQIRTAVFDHVDLLAGLSKFEKSNSIPTRPQDKSAYSGSDMATVFIRELRAAEKHFSTGYVGLNYFLQKWRQPDFEPSVPIRGRILDKLVKNREVEIYRTGAGETAIRVINSAAAATAPPAAAPLTTLNATPAKPA